MHRVFDGDESGITDFLKCDTVETFVGHVDWDIFGVGGGEL